jgi:hypothetical protein
MDNGGISIKEFEALEEIQAQKKFFERCHMERQSQELKEYEKKIKKKIKRFAKRHKHFEVVEGDMADIIRIGLKSTLITAYRLAVKHRGLK